ncbi:hypothetical protein JXA56_01410 [Candidatus Micrarchaeota archaeon]|nr:hypothetical protein [Candidatus Micrarchaeota archaeon]
MKKILFAMAILLLFGASYSVNVDFYYGQGCPHCASTKQLFDAIGGEYGLNLNIHEIYYDAEERSAYIQEYQKFGYDVNLGGVPTSIVEGKTMIIGGMEESQWRSLFEACKNNRCPKGVYSYYTFNISDEQDYEPPAPLPEDGHLSNPVEEKDSIGTVTLSIIIGAAIVDSVNPCTIAVMILLCGAVLCSKGKKDALLSGLIFSAVIFVMYMLYGLGIMKAITSFGLTTMFYGVVTVGALLLAIMELNAYFNYKPGFFAVEMPMFLRPYAKKVTSNATSPTAVALAAILCSIFLLPCSSGPYLVVLGMIAKAATLQTLSYLLLYNFFFVLPMLMISIGIYFGKASVEQIGEAKEKYIKHIHLFSGIILLILFLIMLNQILLIV